MARIQKTVLEHEITDPKDVYQKLRFEIKHEVMPREAIQGFAAQAIQLVSDAKFPVERDRMRLDIAEGELRADLLDALQLLDRSNPRDTRDIYELLRELGGSIGEPSLRKVIDAVTVSGKVDADTCADFARRLVALYPPTEDDNDE